MDKDYDLFERSEGQSWVWRGCVQGLANARRKLHQLAKRTANECSAIDLLTSQVVALANIAHTKRVVFQVAYDEQLLAERSELLKLRGYEVVSVIGNEQAQSVLSPPQPIDLFIVGHNAPEQARVEMVAWLTINYPQTSILALNPSEYKQLPGADYNAVVNSPAAWLSRVAAAFGAVSAAKA